MFLLLNVSLDSHGFHSWMWYEGVEPSGLLFALGVGTVNRNGCAKGRSFSTMDLREDWLCH